MRISFPPQPSAPNTVGSLKWHFRGIWRSSVAYKLGDLVTVGSVMFLATRDMPAGVRTTDSRWARTSFGSRGLAGAKGATGDRGLTGDPGAVGLKGPQGPEGAPGGVSTVGVTWTDIVLTNGWTPVAGNQPQWARDGGDTVWLRGEADNDGATSPVLGAVPAEGMPEKQHQWMAFYQRARVEPFSGSGAISVDDTAHAVHLDTSYKVSPRSAASISVGTIGFAGDTWPPPSTVMWERLSPTTFRVSGHAEAEGRVAAEYHIRSIGAGGIDKGLLQPIVAHVPILYRSQADLDVVNVRHGPLGPDSFYGTLLGASGTITTPSGVYTPQLRIVYPSYYPDHNLPNNAGYPSVPDAPTGAVAMALLVWHDYYLTQADVSATFGDPTRDMGHWTMDLDISYTFNFMDF